MQKSSGVVPDLNMVEVDEHGVARLSKKLNTPVLGRQVTLKCYDMNASVCVWRSLVLMGKMLQRKKF